MTRAFRPIRIARRRSLLFASGFVLASALAYVAAPYSHPDAHSIRARLRPEASKSVIVILFQLADCAGTRDDLARWAALDSTGYVVGLLLNGPKVDDRLREELRLPFEISNRGAGRAAAVAQDLGHQKTPLVFVWSRSGRLVLVAAAARTDLYETAKMLLKE